MGNPFWVTMKVEGLKQPMQEFANKLEVFLYGPEGAVATWRPRSETFVIVDDTTVAFYAKSTTLAKLDAVPQDFGELTLRFEYTSMEYGGCDGRGTIVNGVVTEHEIYVPDLFDEIDWYELYDLSDGGNLT
jgi:hypothetical protein